ncbi:hypothetical protein G6F63_014716 [Rhizopus arrhizus]|nr:hypothetical protein G6F63_014716 [Rhizopus arrhizus]
MTPFRGKLRIRHLEIVLTHAVRAVARDQPAGSHAGGEAAAAEHPQRGTDPGWPPVRRSGLAPAGRPRRRRAATGRPTLHTLGHAEDQRAVDVRAQGAGAAAGAAAAAASAAAGGSRAQRSSGRPG